MENEVTAASESQFVLSLIERAILAMPPSVEDADLNTRVAFIWREVDSRISDACPHGRGPIGMHYARRERELRGLVWPMMLQREADYREDCRAGWEARGENRWAVAS